MEGFTVSWQATDGVCVIKPVGDLDIVTSRQLDEALAEARKAFRQVVLDLSSVDFMDTSSLAVIVGHWKSLEEASGSLALAGARYQSTRSLWITGLADRIPLYPSVQLAVDAASSGPASSGPASSGPPNSGPANSGPASSGPGGGE